MKNRVPGINEQKAATAFTKQSLVFDDIYAGNTIIQYKRQRVRAHVQQYVVPGRSILELNSGTGEDAIWFAQQGYRVHATDISEGMQQALKMKIKAASLNGKITAERCSFTQLETLTEKGPYDLIFSNFAGLNCTDRLDRVLQSLSPLLKPNGHVTLVILPPYCLWENGLLFKGKFKTAFRRFFNRSGGAKARVEGEKFRCWYYPPSYIKKRVATQFNVLSVEGLCTLVPPSYIDGFAEKHPGLYKWLMKKEDRYKSSWPWRSIGDYYIITLQKKSNTR